MLVAHPFGSVFALSSRGGHGASACQGDPSMRPSDSSLSVRQPLIFDAVESYLTRHEFDTLQHLHDADLVRVQQLLRTVHFRTVYQPWSADDARRFRGEV